MGVDVGGKRTLAEGVGDIGPIPILDAGRRIAAQKVGIPFERFDSWFRRDHQLLVGIIPLAAELAEDRRIDIHVLTGTAESAQRRSPKPI